MAKTISFIFYALGFALLTFSFLRIEENGAINFIEFSLNEFAVAIALIAIGYILRTQAKLSESDQEK